MERSKAEEEVREQADEQARLDAVDHERLARLVPARHMPLPSSLPSPVTAAAKKISLPVMLIAVVIALVLLGTGIGAYLMWSVSLKTRPVSQDGGEIPPDSNPQHIAANPKMISIPGGTFQMGRARGLPQEAPPHSVTVPAFQMDNTEVTNAEYLMFVSKTERTPPSHWAGGKPVAGQEEWPVVNVSLDDAKAFAAWRSNRDRVTYRLPTEEEWEYAARNGEQNNLYPWGNEWVAHRAVMRDSGDATLKPVGSYLEGKNRWGVLDLIGNVWEWTSSTANLYPGAALQIPPDQKDWTVIRGGSLASEPRGEKAITAAYRDWVSPNTKFPFLGFRLARSNP
jgi:formylglycine-generating enzyme required for sulfatase activity